MRLQEVSNSATPKHIFDYPDKPYRYRSASDTVSLRVIRIAMPTRSAVSAEPHAQDGVLRREGRDPTHPAHRITPTISCSTPVTP